MAKPRSSPAFQQAYTALNAAQKLAVDTLDGPVMVIAGPGTGKTQILATRIANLLLKTDASPDAILALTFTQSGAQAMRERLLGLLGPTAYRLSINTFHGFCQELISRFPDLFVLGDDQQALSDLDRLEIVRSLLKSRSFSALKPLRAPDLYLSAIISSLQTLKREHISPDTLHLLLKDELAHLEAAQDTLSKTDFVTREKQIRRNLELLELYRLYQKQLKETARYDYEDMINLVLDLLAQDSDLLHQLQEQYQYFLVDEFQDTNSAQNQLTDLLASYWGERANLFVVLDDEQSIYRFQGASLENALQFTARYPSTQIISLTDNYRSQQTILDAARALIEHNRHNLQHQIKSITRQLISRINLPIQPLNLIHLPHASLEHLYLAGEIKALLHQGVAPAEIAILARNNADLLLLSTALQNAKVPHQLQGGTDVLDSPAVKYLLQLLHLIEHSRTAVDDLDLFTVLNYPFLDLDHFEVLRLARSASRQQTPLLNALKASPHPPFVNFLAKLLNWHSLLSTHTFTEFLQSVIYDSRLIDYLLSSDHPPQTLLDLNSFFDFARQLETAHPQLTLSQFLASLETVSRYHLQLPSISTEFTTDKVTLTTAHRAKGLEWEYVFITKCIDRHWGNQIARDLLKLPSSILRRDLNHDPLEDERRLFYVALTRAKKAVYLTFAADYSTTGQGRQTTLSQFVSEIPAALLKPSSPEFSPSEINQFFADRLTPSTVEISAAEADLLRPIINDFKLSVTALNTYLTCPYKFKLNNLYRLPRAKEPYLAFGTAVHAALQKFHQKLKSDQGANQGLTLKGAQRARDEISGRSDLKGHLLEQFEAALKRELLSPEDFRDRLREGRLILSAYFDLHQADFSPPLFTEKSFGSSHSPIFMGDIPLTGKIDRIDPVSNQLVRVVDYKTGSRKTRGQIEGTTQDSNGDTKRQLVFYHLLLDLDQRFPYQATEAVVDFIEAPHKDKKSGRETFTITPTEVEELKAVIKEVMAKIRALDFPRTTDLTTCQRCEFLSHCFPTGLPRS